MHRFSSWALLVSCICACTAPAQKPAQPAAPEPAPSIATPGSAPAPTARTEPPGAPAPSVHEELPPRLAGPAGPVCRLTTEETIWPTVLRRRPGVAPALDVDAHVAMTVSIPPGTMLDGAFADVRGPSGTVGAWQDAADVRLHPAGSLVFGDFVVPQPYTLLAWKRAEVRDGAGMLALTFELDSHVKARVPVERYTRCDEVRLTPGPLEVQAPLGAILFWGELAIATVPVSRAPGGPVLAELAIAPDLPQSVSVHELRDGMARVVYHSFGQLVFGWVPQDLFTRLPHAPQTGFGTGGGFGRSYRFKGHWVEKICDRALPLVLGSQGEAPVTIGELAPGTQFKAELLTPGSPAPRWSAIRLAERRWVQAVGDSELLVPTRALESCRSP